MIRIALSIISIALAFVIYDVVNQVTAIYTAPITAALTQRP